MLLTTPGIVGGLTKGPITSASVIIPGGDASSWQGTVTWGSAPSIVAHNFGGTGGPGFTAAASAADAWWGWDDLQIPASMYDAIDAGTVEATMSFIGSSFSDADSGAAFLEFWTEGKAEWLGCGLSSYRDYVTGPAFEFVEHKAMVPPGARVVGVTHGFKRLSGTELSVYTDSYALKFDVVPWKTWPLYANGRTQPYEGPLDAGWTTVSGGPVMMRNHGAFNWVGISGGDVGSAHITRTINLTSDQINAIQTGNAICEVYCRIGNVNNDDRARIVVTGLTSLDVQTFVLQNATIPSDYNVSGEQFELSDFVPVDTTKVKIDLIFDRVDGTVNDVTVSNIYVHLKAPAYNEDPHWENVALLMNFEDGLNDDSNNGHVATTHGSAAVSTAQAKWGTSSLFLDGSGDYLSIPSAPVLSAATAGDMTIECWIYPTSVSGAAMFINKRDGSSAEEYSVFLNEGVVQAQAFSGGSPVVYISDVAAIAANTWHHVAFTREGTTWKLFVNGIKVDEDVQSGPAAGNTGPLYIGRDGWTSGREFPGYIDDVRITHGVARYTADFDVPTAAFPVGEVKPTDPNWAQVILRMPFETGIVDVSGYGHVVTNNGFQLSSKFSKFGKNAYAITWPGSTGRGLTIPQDGLMSMGSDDFTIELWHYPVYGGSGNCIIGLYRTAATAARCWEVGRFADASTLYSYGSSDSLSANLWDFQVAGVLTLNVWHHICLEREGDVVRLYVNGDMVAKQTGLGATSLYPSTGPLTLAYRDGGSADNAVLGRWDDVRITRGAARYASDAGFAVPTEPHPTS